MRADAWLRDFRQAPCHFTCRGLKNCLFLLKSGVIKPRFQVTRCHFPPKATDLGGNFADKHTGNVRICHAWTSDGPSWPTVAIHGFSARYGVSDKKETALFWRCTDKNEHCVSSRDEAGKRRVKLSK